MLDLDKIKVSKGENQKILLGNSLKDQSAISKKNKGNGISSQNPIIHPAFRWMFLALLEARPCRNKQAWLRNYLYLLLISRVQRYNIFLKIIQTLARKCPFLYSILVFLHNLSFIIVFLLYLCDR